MTQAQFNKYIENISVYERMKENLPNLKIDWETDLSKIDLKVLRNAPKMPDTPEARMSIEWVKTEYLPGLSFAGLFYPDSGDDVERFADLFKLIESGVKIIPPISCNTVDYVNGERKVLKPDSSPWSIVDGGHRIRLSKHLKLDEIPILFLEIPYEGHFSKDQWDLACDGENAEFTNKTTGKKQGFPLANIHFQPFPTGDYTFNLRWN